MTYEIQLAEQEGIINRLRSEIKHIQIPRRTIAWQHANTSLPRNITQRILVARKQRKQLKSNIVFAQKNVLSLREAILGREPQVL